MLAIAGLPDHPLVVHIPVVIIPLAALGTWLIAARPAWFERFRWVVLALTAVGFLGAVVAAANGEDLEDQVRQSGVSDAARRLIHDHADAGESARFFALVFFLAAVAWILGMWIAERRGWARRLPSWTRPALLTLVVLTSIGSVYTVVTAGHSGAKAAWCELSDEGCD